MIRLMRQILLAGVMILGLSLASLLGQSGVYDRTGIIPGHGTQGSLPEENIDLFTGNVTLRFRDVYLPGPNGLDVEVWRVYNSKVLTDWQPGQTPAIQAYHQSWVGMGWTMHMGMVHAYSSSAPVIEFPDGRLERAYPNNCGLGANVYMTRDFLKYDKTYFYPTIYPKVYFKNGVVWTLGLTATITRADGSTDSVRLVTKIDNSFGQFITIEYNTIVAGQYPTIKKITDAFGRIITFTTIGSPRKLSQISYAVTRQYAQSQTRVLSYSVGTFPDGHNYRRLDSFHPPEIAAVSFEYESGQSDHYELKKMTTSYGGTLEYSYSDHLFHSGSTHLNSRVMTQKRIKFTSNPAEEPSVWNYAYPDYDGVPMGTVNIDGPVYDTSVSYNAYDASNPWKQGLIQAFGYGDGSFEESYEWTSHEISSSVFAPLPASVLRHKEGGAVYKEEYLYDVTQYRKYGLASETRRFIGGSETPLNYETISYYFAGRSTWEERYMLAYPATERQFSGTGTKLKEKVTSYYDSGETWKWGAVQLVRIWKHDMIYADWTHVFQPLDSQGKRIQVFVTGPVGSDTQTIYSYGLEEQIKKGDIGSITRTISPTDSAISREAFPEGGLLNYTYDPLGRVLTVDWPTDRYDESTLWPAGENRSVTTKGEPGNPHTITRYWDGMGRDLGYIEQGDGTTLYFQRTLDAEGRLVTETKGSTSDEDTWQYAYNDTGEVTTITDPDGRTTHITLDGTTKTVEDPEHHSTTFEYEHLPGLPTSVTDAQGHVAEYGYDIEGRLLEVDYNNGARVHSFGYDRNDNLISETHPETGLISYTYNDESWMTEKTWGGSTIHYSHNLDSGQIFQVWWGPGYPDYEEEILYTYNLAGKPSRVRSTVKKWDRNIQYDPYGNVASETIALPGLATKTITYTYDGFNNPKRIAYPDSRWSEASSNSLGMPESLVFDNASNYLISSATYGSGRAVTGLTFARNGTQLSASYFPAGQLQHTALTRSGVTLYDASYLYDGNGNILSISSAAPSPTMSATFGYDSLNRLTSAAYSSGRVATFGYTYDEYGNMRTVRENGISVFDKTYESSNRISGDSYDARGNLLSAVGEDAF
ncbi:MAG TPA: hypothetical protein VLN41_00665, partial [Candidatus Bathyarchaeia archaeon]|nr:hypothetical protein [Candidatus Bathyarchaeia archaeon]